MKIKKLTITTFLTLVMLLATYSSVSADSHPFIIEQYGEFGSDNGEFINPYGIEIVNDKYYVTDNTNDRVQVFDLDWNYLNQFGGTGAGNGQLDNPYDIEYNGTYLFVTEVGNDRISIFNENGGFIDSFGESGTGTGQFEIPTSIEFYNDRIYISDYSNGRIQIWNESNLVYLSQISTNIGTPEGLLITDDYMFVGDAGTSLVDVFSMEGQGYLYSIGSASDTPGEMAYPGEIAIFNDYLLISDYADKMLIYDLAGNFVKNIQADLDGPFKFKVQDNSVIIPEGGDHEITILRLTANPSNLVARSSATDVQLSWNLNSEEGIMSPEKYNIYRDDGSGQVFIGQSMVQSFHDSTAEQGIDYTYSIEAISGLATSDKVISNEITLGSGESGEVVTETVTEEGSSNPLPVDLLPFVTLLLLIPLLRIKLR